MTPARKVTRKAVRRSLLVFTEGQVTELDYLTYLRRVHRGVLVKVDPRHEAPKRMTEYAIAAKQADERAERRGEGRGYDEVWLVVDVDEHHDIPEVRRLAQQHGINLAISNPCIELWFVLHYEDSEATPVCMIRYLDSTGPQGDRAVVDGAMHSMDEAVARRLAESAHLLAAGIPTTDDAMAGDGRRTIAKTA